MQQYSSNTKIPGLFTDLNNTKIFSSEAPQQIKGLSSPPQMGSKKKSMPDVATLKNRKDAKNSRSMTKDNTPLVKQMNMTQRVVSPQRPQSTNPTHAAIHSPLEQESTHIKVYARFRPPSRVEQDLTRNGYGNDCALLPDDYTVVLQPDNVIFTFDQTFGLTSTQDSVYKIVGSSTIEDVMNGYNGTIFAYGQTGSGKTYTMFGELRSDNLKGIIPRSIEEIFMYINKCDASTEFILSCSMLEIYKETLYDLLSVNRPDLKIKECPQRGIYVENLTQLVKQQQQHNNQQSLQGQSELLRIVELGEQTRKVAATRINQYSSRSHTIFMLEVRQRYSDDTEKRGKLNLVDLAGSEKVGKTGAMGEILEEAKKINLSLSCLGNVIHAITTGNEHIPYRNSKVTRVLQESLGGNYKTSLIVTCSSHSGSLEETISTLKFASRTKSIRNHFKVNLKVPYEVQQQVIVNLRKELASVRLELEQVKRISLLEIPSEDTNYTDLLNKYDSSVLQNQDKKCFKKNSFQVALEIPSILKNVNNSQQQSSTIDLSFFSQKKPSSAELANTDQTTAAKDREIALTRQIDELSEQNQSLKLELHKKDLKLQFLGSKIQHFERIINKENTNFAQKGQRDVLKNLQSQPKTIQSENNILEEKLSQYLNQLSRQNEVSNMLMSENQYLNKQLELLNSQFEQDRYFQGLLREKIESMNMDYFKKVDHLLNDGMNQSRVVKIISKSRGQSEEIEKKISRNNFVLMIEDLIIELQDLIKQVNPELVRKTYSQLFEIMMGQQLDSAIIELLQQYETTKVKDYEDKQRLELLVLENKRLNDRLFVSEEQLQQINAKNEKLCEAMTQKNQSHRQKLQFYGDQDNKSKTLFRYDYENL